MKKKVFSIFLSVIFAFIVFIQFNCVRQQSENTVDKKAQIERGKFLVMIGDCNACHSPKIMTDRGPMVDTTRILSGHTAGSQLQLNELAGVKSFISTTGDLTAWVGPWGVSFTANLTPDEITGLGNWTADIFIKAMRTGKHMGAGRQLLPPMPFENLANLSDDDLTAILAYLQTIKPIRNKVPDPISPPALAAMMKASK